MMMKIQKAFAVCCDRIFWSSGIWPRAMRLTRSTSCHDLCMSFQCQPTHTPIMARTIATADTPLPYAVHRRF